MLGVQKLLCLPCLVEYRPMHPRKEDAGSVSRQRRQRLRNRPHHHHRLPEQVSTNALLMMAGNTPHRFFGMHQQGQ